jgi:hypothetical protein
MLSCQEAKELRLVFDLLDLDGDGRLTKEEVVQGSEKMGLTETEAANLFEELDEENKVRNGSLHDQIKCQQQAEFVFAFFLSFFLSSLNCAICSWLLLTFSLFTSYFLCHHHNHLFIHQGYLLPPAPPKAKWRNTLKGRISMVALKLMLPILVGALYMQLSGGLVVDDDDDDGKRSENETTTESSSGSFEAWVNAFYFATVTATSVGFGDLVPQVGTCTHVVVHVGGVHV